MSENLSGKWSSKRKLSRLPAGLWTVVPVLPNPRWQMNKQLIQINCIPIKVALLSIWSRKMQLHLPDELHCECDGMSNTCTFIIVLSLRWTIQHSISLNAFWHETSSWIQVGLVTNSAMQYHQINTGNDDFFHLRTTPFVIAQELLLVSWSIQRS